MAAEGSSVHDETRGATLTSLDVRIPHSRSIARHTVVETVQVGGTGRTAAGEGGVVEDEARRAGHTGVS